MRASGQNSNGLMTAALLAIVVSLVGLAGAVKIAQTAVALGPNVGDIVQFDPRGFMPVDSQTQIAVTRPDAGACTLDVETIHANGGSLIVEQRYPTDGNPHYRVHWAGKRTAAGTDNCGQEAEFTLDNANLDMLAMAAGGWGVHHKHPDTGELWTGNATGRMQMR